MKKEKKNKHFDKYRKYGYPLIILLLFLLFSLINPIDDFAEWYAKYSWTDYLFEFSYYVLLASVTIEAGIISTIILDKFIAWEANVLKRIGIQFILQMLFLASSYPIFLIASHYLDSSLISPLSDPLVIRQAGVLGVLLSILTASFFAAEHFLMNWNRTKLQAALSEKKALEIELSALRTQIDPHFLFNNFSILTALIEDNTTEALSYLEKLSSVYRYLLTFRNKHLVSLADEASFINSYLYLYQVRYGKNLIVKVDISEDVFRKRIPPLTLQLLIENAVMHNTISSLEPLHIKVYNPSLKELIVENNINPKATSESGTGLGLKNISQRYKLLGYQEGIEVTNTTTVFIVKIPLIDED